MLLSLGCGDTVPKQKEDTPTVTGPAPRDSSVALLKVQIPNGKGGYLSIGPEDFVGGNYNQDIAADETPPGFKPESDELMAMSNDIFVGGPGFMWATNPPYPVTVTLKARGKSQTLERRPNEGSGKFAVSLYSFGEIFPPAYRERYEISIQSVPGSTNPFTYTYTFAVARTSAQAVFAKVLPGDGPTGLRFGRDNPNYTLVKITTSSKCDGCTIEVKSASASMATKEFIELPALPVQGSLRITYPRRYSGMITRPGSKPLVAQILNNNSDLVTIKVPLPADLTTVKPWCQNARPASAGCQIRSRGQLVPSYFKFLNAVPHDPAESAFGAVSGISTATVTGNAEIIVRRDGNEVEKKTITFDSGVASSLEDPTIPTWAGDELRRMLTSGAPEFSD